MRAAEQSIVGRQGKAGQARDFALRTADLSSSRRMGRHSSGMRVPEDISTKAPSLPSLKLKKSLSRLSLPGMFWVAGRGREMSVRVGAGGGVSGRRNNTPHCVSRASVLEP
jgi:hypothetical protein